MAIDLDISPLERAVAALEAALTRAGTSPDDDMLRDACIQRFEYTYEVSHKMLRRFLAVTSSSPDEIEQLSFPDLIRTGSEKNLLLGDWPRWKAYRNARSITSQTYDEAKAKKVFAAIPGFLDEARFLSARLAERIKA